MNVFSTLYAAPIRSALEKVDVPDIVPTTARQRPQKVTRYLGRIADTLRRWVDESDTNEWERIDQGQDAKDPDSDSDKAWAIQRHLRNLQAIHDDLRMEKITSFGVCLACIADWAQHRLICVHAVCDTCVRRFGELEAKRDHCYRLRRCPVCRTPSHLQVFLKPPTAGVRVLSLDGGGVRVVIALRFLELLQKAIGRAGRIQDYFDIGFGVSAGE